MWASPLHANGAEDDSWTTDDFSSIDPVDIDDDTLLETGNGYQKGDTWSRIPQRRMNCESTIPEFQIISNFQHSITYHTPNIEPGNPKKEHPLIHRSSIPNLNHLDLNLVFSIAFQPILNHETLSQPPQSETSITQTTNTKFQL